MWLLILGREFKLALAELEAIYGVEHVQPLGEMAALVTTQQIEQRRLGGTIKVARLLDELPPTDLDRLSSELSKRLPDYVAKHTNRKINVGISFYGLGNGSKLERAAMRIKKEFKSPNHSLRLVKNKVGILNTAQVQFNQLLTKGLELLVVRHQQAIYVGQTVSVQDIEAYSQRDYGRPKRDAKVGMLPPKLAQIMINLAHPAAGSTILDPFCGTGVVLQEALLAGFEVIGSDIEPRMIEYTKANLEWLDSQLQAEKLKFELTVADARQLTLKKPVGAVVSETYLGPPLFKPPGGPELARLQKEITQLIEATLQNLATQLPGDTRLCLAVPAWRTVTGFSRLPLEKIEKLGYNRLAFKHAPEPLLYARSEQIVARELLLLVKE